MNKWPYQYQKEKVFGGVIETDNKKTLTAIKQERKIKKKRGTNASNMDKQKR